MWVHKCFRSRKLDIFNSSPIYPTIFLSRRCHYISCWTCHIIPHIYSIILLIFHQFLKKKTGSTRCNQTLDVSWRWRKTVHIIGIEQVQTGPDPFRHVKHIAKQWRRNGTETWRRRSCQCERLHLITHERILLNGDVPRRNGNVTFSVKRPLGLYQAV
jgi:hypothetical protein